jgi:hypothetical protein
MSKKKSKKSPKPKKEKIIWVDDGSTVADMSGVGRKPRRDPRSEAARSGKKPPSRMRACADTYFATMRMMVKPMLITIGIICAVFLLLWLGMGALEGEAAGMIPANLPNSF